MAGYVEQSLQPGEVVEYRGRVSWMYALHRPVAYLIIGGVLLNIANSSGNSSSSGGSLSAGGAIAATIGVLFALGGMISVVRAVLFVVGAEYAVTDRRVIGKYGIVRRNVVDVNMKEISGVSLGESFLGRIFRYGTVWVMASGTRRALVGLSQPLRFRAAVYHRLEESKLLKGTAAYTLDVRIAPDPPASQATAPDLPFPPAPRPSPVYQQAQGNVPDSADISRAAPGPVTRYCGQCGTAIQSAFRFCASCGAALE